MITDTATDIIIRRAIIALINYRATESIDSIIDAIDACAHDDMIAFNMIDIIDHCIATLNCDIDDYRAFMIDTRNRA